MEPRISLVTLGVADLDRAIDFYENTVGWKRIDDCPPGIAFFDLGGLAFSLYPHSEMVKECGEDFTPLNDYHGFALAYNARSDEDVDSIFEALRSRGATILKEPEKVFWGGYSGYFADPDGHKWEVAHNPHWTIREDGRISMKKKVDE